MAPKLNSQQLTLLREVLEKRRPDMLFIFDSPTGIELTEKQRFELCQSFTDEFCVTGLGQNSEPNARGLLLEDLIDLFHPKLKDPTK